MITASQIKDLLAERHSKDIFVTECHNGTTYAELFIFDAFAMEKSYANPRMIVYEIKVSRSDFMHDRKVEKYLDYCNEIYFVTPPNLILKTELPDGFGLIETSTHAKKLITRVKARYRKVEFPVSVFQYILFSRTKIVSSYNPKSQSDYFREWVDSKDKRLELNLRIKQKIRQVILDTERENEQLKAAIKNYDDLIDGLRAADIDINRVNRWNITQALNKRIYPRIEIDRNIRSAIKLLESILSTNSVEPLNNERQE